MTRPTPLIPEIAQLEGEPLPPFQSFTCMPDHAMFDTTISNSAKVVLAAIIKKIRGKRIDCAASNRELAEVSGLTLSVVREGLEQLDRSGYITRHTDRDANPGDKRRIVLRFQTWDSSNHDTSCPENDVNRRSTPCRKSGRGARAIPQGGAGNQAGGCRKSGRGLPIDAPAETVFETSFETSESKDVTCVRTIPELTKDQPLAEVIETPEPEEPAAPSLLEFWKSRGLPTRQHRESPRPSVCPPPKPPERPVQPPAPRPTTVSASTAMDGVWAKLMASVKPEPATTPTPVVPAPSSAIPVPSSAIRHPSSNPSRPEVGPPRGAEIPELVRNLERGGPQAVADLVAALAARWKDRKPETLAFWTSALAEVGAKLLSADLVAALAKDADRKSVKHKARQFSKTLGQELAIARQAQKKRLPGRRQTAPAGGQNASPQTSSHFTMNGSSRK